VFSSNRNVCWFVISSTSLTHVNTLLHEQLEQATSANEGLTRDLSHMSAILDELKGKEGEWKKEEQVRYVVKFLFR